MCITPNMDLHYQGFMAPIISSPVDGYYVQTLESVIVEKTLRGREKDLSDVEMIISQMDNQIMVIRE